MLTLKMLRDDPEHVIEKLAVKNFDARAIVEDVIRLDANRRALQTESDSLIASQKQLSARIGSLMKEGRREEAEEVLNRLVELGCKPEMLQEAMKTIEFPFYEDPKQQIESDYNPEAVQMMSVMAEAFKDDYPTQKLIYKWIDGEKEHMAWEAQYLNYIDKLGYENFLTAMM